LSNVDLSSNRCSPCKTLAPTISSLADKYADKVAVRKVDVDRIPVVAQRYGMSAIPTVLIINNGKELRCWVGLQTEAKYFTILDKLANQSKGQVSH